MALATRKIMEEKREKGEITRGPAPFNRADRSKFLNQMEMIVQKQESANLYKILLNNCFTK